MGFLLLLPFFVVRFGLLFLLNQEVMKRAAYFAPLLDSEKVAYWLYQISNVAIVLCLLFLNIKLAPIWLLCTGVAVYAAYFMVFFGCVLLTQSPVLLVFVLVFQITAHWIIRSEERWCIQRFGDEYLQYMERVRRYF